MGRACQRSEVRMQHFEPSQPVPQWCLAQLRPNCLAKAQRNLARQGFTLFCPTCRETRRRNGRFVEQNRPLFPGYLFVGFDPETSPWRAINSTYGVSRLVSFGDGYPAPVPMALISSLMLRCDPEGQLLPPPMLAAGAEVKVKRGPFAEFVGTVENLAPEQRVWVLLDIMGRATRVAVKAGDLQVQ